MGFKRQKIYKLTWDTDEDDELNGLVVRAGTVPMGVYLDLKKYCLEGVVPDQFEGDDERAFRWTVEQLTGALRSWNLETDDGKPVEATHEAFWSQDQEFIMRVVVEWVRALGVVSAPLKKPSPAGEQSVAASIPMESLSESQAS